MCGSLRSQPRAHAGNGARRGHDRRRHRSTRGARRRPGASAWRGLPHLPLRPLGGPAMRVPAICAGPAGRLPIGFDAQHRRVVKPQGTPSARLPERPSGRSGHEARCRALRAHTRLNAALRALARALNTWDTHETFRHMTGRTPHPPAPGPITMLLVSLDAPYSHLPACISDFSPHRGCELLASCGRPIPACRAHARNFTCT